jgi:hypothetical protein
VRARIGKYVNYIGPYQIAGWLEHLCVQERDRDRIGDWLARTRVNDFCAWVHSKRKRHISVKPDYWDHWGADETMSMLILPILKNLRLEKHGAGSVADEDVPAGFRSTDAPPRENEWDIDANHFRRYEWMLDEVIWALEQLQSGDDWEEQFHTGNIDFFYEKIDGTEYSEMKHGPNHTHQFDVEGYKAYSARIDNGLRLMGTYWRTFWD